MICSEIIDLFRIDEEEELFADKLHGFEMCREWWTEGSDAAWQ
jgi:hypothetical protein